MIAETLDGKARCLPDYSHPTKTEPLLHSMLQRLDPSSEELQSVEGSVNRGSFRDDNRISCSCVSHLFCHAPSNFVEDLLNLVFQTHRWFLL